MRLHEELVQSFIKVMQFQGAGEYFQSKNPMSHSRLPWQSGIIYISAPAGGYVEVGTTEDIKEIRGIWERALGEAREAQDGS